MKINKQRLLKELLIPWAEAMCICILVVYSWQALELIFFKEIRGNIVDSIVGFVLVMSLFSNLQHSKNKKVEKEKV